MTETDIPDTSDLDAQIVSFLVDRLKQFETPFKRMSEAEQRAVIHDAQEAARHYLQSVVKRLAADGRQTIEAEMAKVVNDGKRLQGTLECKTDDQYRHALLDSVGTTVLLVVADAEQYTGGELPEPDPDQRDLERHSGGNDGPVADSTRAAA